MKSKYILIIFLVCNFIFFNTSGQKGNSKKTIKLSNSKSRDVKSLKVTQKENLYLGTDEEELPPPKEQYFDPLIPTYSIGMEGFNQLFNSRFDFSLIKDMSEFAKFNFSLLIQKSGKVGDSISDSEKKYSQVTIEILRVFKSLGFWNPVIEKNIKVDKEIEFTFQKTTDNLVNISMSIR